MFHAGWDPDRRRDKKGLIVAFHNFPKAPKNGRLIQLDITAIPTLTPTRIRAENIQKYFSPTQIA